MSPPFRGIRPSTKPGAIQTCHPGPGLTPRNDRGFLAAFLAAFVAAYDHEHHHTGICLHTPADVHYGHTTAFSAQRSAALAAAREAHPERFTTRQDPKILALPTDEWIKRPAETPAA